MISLIMEGKIIKLQDWLNNYPRRIFNCKSVNEMKADLKEAA